MPALRIIIIETQSRLEQLLLAACRGKPAHIIKASDVDSLTRCLFDHPPGIVLMEHQADLAKTVSLIEQTVSLGSCAIVFLTDAISDEARIVLRTAGAVQLIDQLPPFQRWQAWVDRWMEEFVDEAS